MRDMRNLRGKIIQKYGSQNEFAAAIGTTAQTVTAKLNGRSQFSQGDIIKWCNALDIDAPSIGEYFFDEKLSNFESPVEQ